MRELWFLTQYTGLSHTPKPHGKDMQFMLILIVVFLSSMHHCMRLIIPHTGGTTAGCPTSCLANHLYS